MSLLEQGLLQRNALQGLCFIVALIVLDEVQILAILDLFNP